MMFRELVSVVVLCSSGVALAQDADTEVTGRAEQAIQEGALLPFTGATPRGSTRINSVGTYRGPTDLVAVDLIGTVQATQRLQVQAAIRFEDADSDPAVAVQYTLLEQGAYPVDLLVGAGWDAGGVNEVSAGFAQVAAGRMIGDTYVLGSARFDVGSDSEVGTRFGAAAVYGIGEGLFVGGDSRIEVDLERDSDEPMDEASWSMTAGPLVSYARDQLALTVSGGLATHQPRGEDTDVGGYGSIGFGLVF